MLKELILTDWSTTVVVHRIELDSTLLLMLIYTCNDNRRKHKAKTTHIYFTFHITQTGESIKCQSCGTINWNHVGICRLIIDAFGVSFIATGPTDCEMMHISNILIENIYFLLEKHKKLVNFACQHV